MTTQSLGKKALVPTNLYTTLSKNGVDESTPLTKKELETLRSISNLSEREARAIKDLIIQHKLKELEDTNQNNVNVNDIVLDQPPYGGVQLPNGTEFPIGNLPLDLARVIVKFVEMTKRNV
jgi:hypothetical protein